MIVLPARNVPTSVQSQNINVMVILATITVPNSPQSSKHSQDQPEMQKISMEKTNTKIIIINRTE